MRFAAEIVIDFWWAGRRGGEGSSDGVGDRVGSRVNGAGGAGSGGEGNLRAVSTWLSCDGANASVPCSNFEVGLRFRCELLAGKPSSELVALYVRLVLRDCELMTMRW